jgi:hypothetical protein
VLAYFDQTRRRAVQRDEEFGREGVAQCRPDLVGGGLLRSRGGWAHVLALRRKGSPIAADARILGSGEFVEGLLTEASRKRSYAPGSGNGKWCGSGGSFVSWPFRAWAIPGRRWCGSWG